MHPFAVVELLVLGSAIVSSVACVITRRVDVAHVARASGVAVAVVGALAILLGVMQLALVGDTPGLSQATEQRMFSSVVAESLDYAAITNVASAIPFFLGSWVLRKHAAKSAS